MKKAWIEVDLCSRIKQTKRIEVLITVFLDGAIFLDKEEQCKEVETSLSSFGHMVVLEGERLMDRVILKNRHM